ncbi:hypothetical protein PIIN_09332 [Serendipita indica DSM 11827]|uniref:F-box domain-containing protein n=1 Tax=Serendipita indica (strain DSM 11827) TaxID=1109443 RepID=G4TVK5_SERID|nr:hypothetical protein PIIN_09332 [Serendipita indica DSM 11827]
MGSNHILTVQLDDLYRSGRCTKMMGSLTTNVLAISVVLAVSIYVRNNMRRAEFSNFVNLPLQIVVHILEQLRARDILAVEATCRRLKFFIDQSSVLQLITELAVQGLRLRTYPPVI